MRSLPASLFFLALSLPAGPSLAQVSTNDSALDALKPDTSEKPQAARKPAPATARKTTRAPVARRTVVLPAVPAGPPANPVIAPPAFVMPAHKQAPPPPVPVKADAAGAASDIAGGLRITFGADSSDLNPATLAALRALAARAVADPRMVVDITAWAPGLPDDPSTPRRLSLDRALAARAVLINAGVVSERIRAVAKGPMDIGEGPPDRADLVQAGKAAPAP